MDNTIRRNEICAIGLPRCDFVFSATRTCFIAYGFNESPLEMKILSNILEKLQIQPIEAGGSLAPGQNAFCTKICSKIIMAQFCIVLLNNDQKGKLELPNANVNMEYGLMLGFNKYIIPFQKQSQKLPFNVAGLDTIKYTDQDLEQKAIPAIEDAIKKTAQFNNPAEIAGQSINLFLLSKNMLITHIDTEGDRNIFRLGEPLGFNLINDFSGFNYAFLGSFTNDRPEVILWKIYKINDILEGRFSDLDRRIELFGGKPEQIKAAKLLIENLKLWIIVTSEQDKHIINSELDEKPINYQVEIYSLDNIWDELNRIYSY